MNIGVIGLGSIGKRHARNLTNLGHRVYGYDIDPSLDGFLCGKFSDVDELIGSCEAVIIASPTATHLDYLEKAVLAKKPALVEKPLSDGSLTRAQLIMSMAKLSSVPVMMGCMLRLHRCVNLTKKFIDGGEIGEILWAQFDVAQENHKYPDHVILNWGSHELDLAQHLLGPSHCISSFGNNMIADVTLLHEKCRSTIHLDYLTEPEIRTFLVVGEKGNIAVDLPRFQLVIERKDGISSAYDFSDVEDWDAVYQFEAIEFLRIAKGGYGPSCAASGEDGLSVLEICLDAMKGGNGHG